MKVATTRLQTDERAASAAYTAENDATAAAERAATALATARDSHNAVAAELADAPDLPSATAALVQLDALDEAVRDAGTAMLQVRQIRQNAAAEASRVAQHYASAWQAVRTARDPLVALGAPELTTGTVSAAWTALTSWAAHAANTTATARDAANTDVDLLSHKRIGAAQELRDRFADLAVPLSAHDPADAAAAAIAAAVAQARAEHTQIVSRQAEAATLQRQRERQVEEQRVAAELARLLRSNNFPEWLEATALDALVEDASEKLEQLV